MSFSKSYLEKYGWKEGEGLGKNQTGILEPIIPSMKFNRGGIGFHARYEYIDAWWVEHYKKALQKSALKSKKNEESDSEYEVEIITSSNANDLNKSCKAHNKTTSKFVENVENKDEHVIKSKNKRKAFIPLKIVRACEGRTAHKGARQSMKCNWKLQKQEPLLLHKNEKNDDIAFEEKMSKPNDKSNCKNIVNKRKLKTPIKMVKN